MRHQFQVGNLVVDLTARRAMLREQEIPFSRLEFDVLAYLAQQAGRVVTYNELLVQVWGRSRAEGSTLDQVKGCVKRLRHKLDAHPGSQVKLTTVRGIGWRLDADPDLEDG
jgi:two-component system KDP operon response regulator KdpE